MSASARSSQTGLTLVELMVSLALSLLLLAGLLHVFVSSRQAHRTNEGLSRVQESGRFALDFLSHDLRSTGHKGSCGAGAPVNNLLNPSGTGYSADLFDLNRALVAWDNSSGSLSGSMVGYRTGTDVMLLKHAANPSGATASGNTPANAATINLTAASGVRQGAIVVVADSRGCDMFQNVSNSNANTLNRGTAGGFQPGNLNPSGPGGNPFSHKYDDTMEILTFRSALYYIGAGASGLPALRRRLFDAGSAAVNQEDLELVEGILDLQLLYGVDTDGDLEADDYVAAGAVGNWDDVVAARMCVVAISTDANVATDALTLNCNGASVAVPDGRLAQSFTSTIALRNRLP